jgi:hypothetical protein
MQRNDSRKGLAKYFLLYLVLKCPYVLSGIYSIYIIHKLYCARSRLLMSNEFYLPPVSFGKTSKMSITVYDKD